MNENFDKKNILFQFNDICLHKNSKPLNLKLFFGSQIILKTTTLEDISTYGDLILGTDTPISGEVIFKDKNWSNLKPNNAETLRSHIKRVFRNRGWISNLTLSENIELSMLYHTKKQSQDIALETLKLAQIFNIENILDFRPFKCSLEELKIMQWIRCLSGDFSLAVLENPFINDKNKNELLFNLLNEKTKKGISIIWLLNSVHNYEILLQEKIEIINIE